MVEGLPSYFINPLPNLGFGTMLHVFNSLFYFMMSIFFSSLSELFAITHVAKRHSLKQVGVLRKLNYIRIRLLKAFL
jgi:hypothetical protein